MNNSWMVAFQRHYLLSILLLLQLKIKAYVQKDKKKVSNIDKDIKHLNKNQKVIASSLEAIEMIMMSLVKTVKTLISPKRQANAKQQVSNIIYNLEINKIEENENNYGSHPTNQNVVNYFNYHSNNDVIHHEDDYPGMKKIFFYVNNC